MIVGLRFFGYGEISQVGEGLEQRLHARAFIVRSAERAWVYVICDLGMMSRRVRRLVEERVREQLGDRYPPECLCLTSRSSATATTRAIAAADGALAPGSIGFAVGSSATPA
jgi:hypothetical protein